VRESKRSKSPPPPHPKPPMTSFPSNKKVARTPTPTRMPSERGRMFGIQLGGVSPHPMLKRAKGARGLFLITHSSHVPMEEKGVGSLVVELGAKERVTRQPHLLKRRALHKHRQPPK